MTFKTWLETLDSFDGELKDMLINEMQRTHFFGNVPQEFLFLKGVIVDLGFDNYGDPTLTRKVLMAFGANGVTVPGTVYRLRLATSLQALVELGDGSETATLPLFWKQTVLVVDNNDRYSWIGQKVPPDQYPKIDFTQYTQSPEGWILK